MTSSARARIAGSTVRPSALAVLRFTSSSNVVGCWTGSSAGLAPLRILLSYMLREAGEEALAEAVAAVVEQRRAQSMARVRAG
jgi:hypothetical protein